MYINCLIPVPSKILNYSTSNEVRVSEGSDVTLVCNATGVPPPKITWYRRSGEDNEERESEFLITRKEAGGGGGGGEQR